MELEELNVYNRSMELGEEVWRIIIGWDYFTKDTIGKQMIRSADSIAANISEGFGRFHFKESKQFNYYARGSLFETKTWLTKSYNRKLITKEQFENLLSEIEITGKMLNKYIKSTGIQK